MYYLTTLSRHFIYGYMASDIWLRTILIVRKETPCCHIGYSFWLTARVLLYAPSHRQDSTYHSLCYTSRGALAGMRYSSMGPPHEGSVQWPIAPWANALTTELHLTPRLYGVRHMVTDHSAREATLFWLAARVLLYASSHRQNNTHQGLCYTIRGTLARTRYGSMGPPLTWLRIDPMIHRNMSKLTPWYSSLP